MEFCELVNRGAFEWRIGCLDFHLLSLLTFSIQGGRKAFRFPELRRPLCRLNWPVPWIFQTFRYCQSKWNWSNNLTEKESEKKKNNSERTQLFGGNKITKARLHALGTSNNLWRMSLLGKNMEKKIELLGEKRSRLNIFLEAIWRCKCHHPTRFLRTKKVKLEVSSSWRNLWLPH